ncbi:MAG: serine--tRNA ligase, partial [Rhodospirillales bacterium]
TLFRSDAAASEAATALNASLAELPNTPLDDVPDGADENDNRVDHCIGEPPEFDFEPKEHFDIGKALGMMDFETAAKLAGERFVMLSGALAQMERALANFMLDHNTREYGYTEVNPPALVNDVTMFGTGQLPKFGDDLFSTSKSNRAYERTKDTRNQQLLRNPDEYNSADIEHLRELSLAQDWQGERSHDRLWLIPTAEVPLTNIVADQIVVAECLPRRYTAMSWCFRSEAGAAGKDTRGMIRQHQFTKVEMVSVTTPEQSADELERMTKCAEDILKRLSLPFRTVTLCTGDMGFGACKTYDIEVWLPGQDRYREISSCSNCGDFQARRMKARFRDKGAKETRFVHTLNGSGLAVGRTLIAIMENGQQADGSVAIPETLRPYMGGLEVILANGD